VRPDGRVQRGGTSRLRHVLEGTGPFPAVALVLAAVGLMLLLLTLNCIGGLVYTGQAVHGNEQDGIVVYCYRGNGYSL
jgi:hypothetical protein